jgi:hypothetical protein
MNYEKPQRKGIECSLIWGFLSLFCFQPAASDE